MLFGVFDGHGGAEVSKFAHDKFGEMFMASKEFKAGKFDEALT